MRTFGGFTNRFEVAAALSVAPLLLCILGPPARADGFSSSRKSDSATYSLSVAGGVAGPSFLGFRRENPAGLIYNQNGRILGYLATDRDHPETLSNGLSFLAGNGEAAASIGVQSFNNATDEGGSITRLNFGMATYSETLNLSMGLSGSYRFQKPSHAVAPELQPTWTADLGLLYNPFGTIQIGAQAYDLSRGVSAFGAGVATHINSFSLLAVDVSTNNRGRGLTLKPGLGVRAAAFHITYGYGMQAEEDRGVATGISVGNTLGVGYEFSPQFRMLGSYNQFSTYFLGATIDLF